LGKGRSPLEARVTQIEWNTGGRSRTLPLHAGVDEGGPEMGAAEPP
jgi:hypothetical protein